MYKGKRKIKVASVFWGALKYTIGVVVTSLRSAKQMYERKKKKEKRKKLGQTRCRFFFVQK
jgi:Ni/Fe-hydrogenase subunit HybB-like protein